MSLNATNFVAQGPIKSADMRQFVDLFTGVMTDQPVTFKNTLMVGGSQSNSTPPLKLFGATGQTGNLIELYPTAGSANATFGFAALGQFAWGPGSPAANDTFLSRIALQNGHATDTAGVLIDPYLEVKGNVSALGYVYQNGATIAGPAGTPFLLQLNQDLIVNRHISAGGHQIIGATTPPGAHVGLQVSNTDLTGSPQYGIIEQARINNNGPATGLGIQGQIVTQAATWTLANAWTFCAASPTIGAGNTVTTMIGVRVLNQGHAQVTNSFGVYIDPQSGSTATSVGLQVAGTSVTILGGRTAIGGSITGGGEMLRVYGSVYVQHSQLWLNDGANAATLYMGDVNIARWNPGQLRIYSSNSAGLTVGGPIVIESDYALQFGVNGYAFKGYAGRALLYTNADLAALNGSYYIESGLTARMYWDGGNFCFSHNVKVLAGRIYLGGAAQTYFEMWNPGEMRLSSSPGNFYNIGALQSDGSSITCAGGPCRGNGAYVNTASSKTLKTNVATLEPEMCLDQVRGLRSVSFEYITPVDFGPKAEKLTSPDRAPTPATWSPQLLGFIAEEVAEVVPQAVGMIDDVTAAGLTPESLIPVLWGAVRALSAKVEQLERAA